MNHCLLDIFHKFSGKTTRQAPVGTAWNISLIYITLKMHVSRWAMQRCWHKLIWVKVKQGGWLRCCMGCSVLCYLKVCHNFVTGRGSSIGSESAWHASGPEFNPHVRHMLSWRLGHENISMAILLFRWFKKSSCQLLAKECALSTGKLPGRLAQEQCG